jgi:hypothetical protein
MLMDRQLKANWPKHLDRIAKRLNPAHSGIFGDFRAPYYWSTFQSEWATDVMAPGYGPCSRPVQRRGRQRREDAA